MIISGSCTAVTCLVIFTLMAMHATRFSNPNEQTKYTLTPSFSTNLAKLSLPRIMRICLLLPLYSIFSFLSICFPNAYVYLEGWTEFFQGMALYTFLVLICDFLAPDDRRRVYFFMSMRIPKKGGGGQTGDGLAWLHVRSKPPWLLPSNTCLMLFPTENLVPCRAIPGGRFHSCHCHVHHTGPGDILPGQQ